MVKGDGMVVLTLWEKHEDSIFERIASVLETLTPGKEQRSRLPQGPVDLRPRFVLCVDGKGENIRVQWKVTVIRYSHGKEE